MSTLREQMLEDLQLKGATVKTQRIYLREVRNYAKYFGKSPEELGENELREYLLCLMKERKLSGVMALLSVTENIKHKAILTLTYSSGLRISEVAALKITDIDSKRMMVYIRQGKGGKDRYSILSQTTLECLRHYWREHRPKEWLCEGQKPGTHITLSSITQIFQKAKKRAAITKRACVHTLCPGIFTQRSFLLINGKCIFTDTIWQLGDKYCLQAVLKSGEIMYSV